MVVTCEKCHTRFLLDEARIHGARAQARCSRCQHVFWVEREEGVPEGEHPEDEEAGVRAGAAGRSPLTAEEDTFRFRESEEEPEPAMAAAKAALPKPSVLFTTPGRRFTWPWIIGIASGLLGGVLVGAVIMWFGGYGWMAKHLKVKSPALAPTAKVTETSKVEIVPPPPAPPASAEDLKNLEITNQEERYRGLVNAKGGQVLLIQGKVKNSSPQPRGPIKIKAMLTDPQQKTVKEREFYAGTVVFDDELQNLDPGEINRWLDTPGGRAQKQVLEPGESQSFMVVFFGAPQSLSGYGYKMQVVKGAVASSPSRRK